MKSDMVLSVCRGRGKNALCRVKKGGGGGKFTWGTLMSAGMDRTASPTLDRNDPNYESDAEIGLLRTPSMQSQPLKRYKEAVRCLLSPSHTPCARSLVKDHAACVKKLHGAVLRRWML